MKVAEHASFPVVLQGALSFVTKSREFGKHIHHLL